MNPQTEAPETGRGRTTLAVLGALASAALVIPLIVVPLDWQGQTLLAVVLAVAAWLLGRWVQAPWITLALMSVSVFLTARYGYWRVTETLGFGDPLFQWYDFVCTFLLLGAELYAWSILLMGYVQTAWPLERKPVPLASAPEDWPHVDIYIPTYNEPLAVVEPTIIAACNIDWPRDKLHVYVLDDGGRDEFKAFAESLGAGYIARPGREHAKAGNLNHALGLTASDYVAIFDCDHVPARSFLQVAMGWMLRDAKIALLQTPHHFYSPDPFERNLRLFKQVPNEGELFYGLVQDGNDLWNAAFFCGSCAVMRRDALMEIGGIAVETVTEDAHTALRLQRRGWHTAYLKIPQAAGLATENLASHIGQRIRWARGMVQIFRTDNPLLGRGLNLWQRLCYVNAMAHFLYAVPRLIFLTAPLAFLLFDLRLLSAYALTFAAYSLPHLVMANLTNSRIQGKYRHSFWSEVYETVLAPYILLPTLLALVNPKLGKFNVTAKGGVIFDAFYDRDIARPLIVLWALNVAGLVAAGVRLAFGGGDDTSTVWITGLWTVYNLVIISAAMAVAREDRQLREAVRVPLEMPASLLSPEGERPCLLRDVSDGGVSITSGDGQPLAGDTAHALRLHWNGVAHDLPVNWVSGDGRQHAARFAFGALTLAQRVHLVRLLYTRADAWLDWDRRVNRDRPLASLGLIVRIAVVGSAHMLGGVFRARRVAKRAVLGLALGLGLATLALPPGEARAQTTQSAQSFAASWSFAALGYRQGLAIAGAGERQTLYFDIPEDKLVRTADVLVRLQQSGPADATARLEVLQNGAPLAAWRLDSAARSFRVRLDPYLLTQRNALEFRLVAENCAAPGARALSVRVLPTSQLALDGAPLAVAGRLERLPAPFFQRYGQNAADPLRFYLPGDTPPRVLQAAGVVASWFGVTAANHSPRFEVSQRDLPRGNFVAFIDQAQGVPTWAADFGQEALDGPAVAIRPHPGLPSARVLILTGRNPDDVLRAAQALASGQAALRGDSASLARVALPSARQPNDAPRWLAPGKRVTLGQLAAPETLQIAGSGYISVPFRLAPGLYFDERHRINFDLRYRYNSVLAGDGSQLAVSFNHQPLRGVELARGGAGNASLQTGVAGRWVLPQDNKLDFRFAFAAPEGAGCAGVAGVYASVSPDSSIDLSAAQHYARLPNLAVLGNGGYPYTRYADLARTAAVLPAKPGAGLLALYLGVLAQFGAQTGYPALRLETVAADAADALVDKDLLIFGEPADQPLVQAWSDDWLLRASADGWRAQELGWGPGRLLRAQRWLAFDDGGDGAWSLRDDLARDPWPRASIQQIVSPLGAGRVATLLVARDPAGWLNLETALLDGDARAGVFGNLYRVGRDGNTRSYLLDAPDFHLGTLAPWSDLMRRLADAPLTVALVAGGAALAQAWLFAGWLRVRARARLAGRI